MNSMILEAVGEGMSLMTDVRTFSPEHVGPADFTSCCPLITVGISGGGLRKGYPHFQRELSGPEGWSIVFLTKVILPLAVLDFRSLRWLPPSSPCLMILASWRGSLRYQGSTTRDHHGRHQRWVTDSPGSHGSGRSQLPLREQKTTKWWGVVVLLIRTKKSPCFRPCEWECQPIWPLKHFFWTPRSTHLSHLTRHFILARHFSRVAPFCHLEFFDPSSLPALHDVCCSSWNSCLYL